MKKYVKDLQIGDVIIHSYGQRTFLGFAENQDQSPLMKDWVEILLFDEKHQRNINITVKYSNQVEVRDVFTLEYIINYLEEFFYSKECHDLARNKKQCFLEGLQILSKYDADVVPEFDHDICWASSFGLSRMSSNISSLYPFFISILKISIKGCAQKWVA